MAVDQVGQGTVDGTNVFQSGEKGAFFGTTPVVQPTSASQAAVTATAVTAVITTGTTTTSPHGFATGTQGDAIIARVNQAVVDVGALTTLTNQIRSELVALGLLKGS